MQIIIPPRQKATGYFNVTMRPETLINFLAAGLSMLIMTAPAFRYCFFDEE
jgi:hypothetical protein